MAEILIFSKGNELFDGLRQHMTCGIELVSQVERAKELLYCCNIRAVIIDLDEQEKDGFLLAAYLRGIYRYYLLPVIFLASDGRCEKTAFHNFHCFDYLTKPVPVEKLTEILNLICGRFDPLWIPKGLVLRLRGGVHRVEMADIVYLEILNRNLVVHTIYDERHFPYRRLGECIDQGRGDLVQCHRAFVVNCAYVERLDYAERQVLLKGGRGAVALGQKYMKELRERLDEWRRVKYTTEYQHKLRENLRGDTDERTFSDSSWKAMQ